MKVDELYPYYIFCFNHCLVIREFALAYAGDTESAGDYLLCSYKLFDPLITSLLLDEMDDEPLIKEMKKDAIFLKPLVEENAANIVIINHGVLKKRTYSEIKDSKGNILENKAIYIQNLKNDEGYTSVYTNPINGYIYYNIINSNGDLVIDKWLNEKELRDIFPKEYENCCVTVCYNNGKILAMPYYHTDVMEGEIAFNSNGEVNSQFKKY